MSGATFHLHLGSCVFIITSHPSCCCLYPWKLLNWLRVWEVSYMLGNSWHAILLNHTPVPLQTKNVLIKANS